jgi:hypothetical protein
LSFNGTGTFNQATAPVVAGTVISSTNYNTQNTDFANGLSNVVCKDGQTTPTANLPMGTYRHTGVGNAVARTDYAATGQVQDGSFIWCGTAGGTKNALTLTPSPAITAYATGQKFRFKSGATQSDDAVTIAISGLTTKAAEIDDAALSATSYIEADKIYEAIYDGTAFQVAKFSVGASTVVTGAETITAGENLADRDIIYQDVFNQRSGGATRWYKVDTDATGPVRVSPRIGIALAAITSGNTGSAQVRSGRVSGFTGLTAGQSVWASTTAGGTTQTAPPVPSTGTQNATVLIGVAASTTEIDFEPPYEVTFTARNSALTVGTALEVEHFTDAGARERVPRPYLVAGSVVQTLVDRTTGTAIGNMANGGGLAAAFDGNTSQNAAASASLTAGDRTTGYVGKDWGSGVTKVISGIIAYSPTDQGFNQVGTDLATITLYGSTDNFSGSNVNLGSGTITNGTGITFTKLSGFTTTTAYRYHRIGITSASSGTASENKNCAELSFYEDITPYDEPLPPQPELLFSGSTTAVTVRFTDASDANADTKTTFRNRTNATRDIAAEVTI